MEGVNGCEWRVWMEGVNGRCAVGAGAGFVRVGWMC